jgi:hypothetical protein
MDREELLELVTTEDVIEIMKDLGSDTYKIDNQQNLYFLNVCHYSDNHKHKLHYFPNSKMFMCYTCCGSMSLYDVIISCKGVDFREAYKYLCEYKNISTHKKMRIGIQKRAEENQDLNFLKFHLYKKDKPTIQLPTYNSYILNIFDDYIPMSWYKEGIDEKVAEHFNIRYYINQNKGIIPHYDINGNLVGIRSRNFFQHEVDSGKKYMPITIQGLTYRYPMNFNLYGLYQNKENIRKFKRAIIFESEKAVLLYASYFGQENNIALASSGMTISLYQRDLLLSLGVEEIIIAYDKQYQLDLIHSEDKTTKAWKEYEGYIKRLIKISNMFIDYCNISIITCWDDRLDYKSAPIDHGKETFQELYKERYYVNDIEELREMID